MPRKEEAADDGEYKGWETRCRQLQDEEQQQVHCGACAELHTALHHPTAALHTENKPALLPSSVTALPDLRDVLLPVKPVPGVQS